MSFVICSLSDHLLKQGVKGFVLCSWKSSCVSTVNKIGEFNFSSVEKKS